MLAKRAEPAVTIPREYSETFRQLVDDVQDVAIFMLDGVWRISTWYSGAAVIGFAKVTLDLTARNETQDALHRSEQTFQLLVESIQDCAIFMLDPDGRVASWNAAAERIQGYRAHEIMGEHFSTFYPPDD